MLLLSPYATSGNDSATLLDTVGNDTLFSAPKVAKICGAGYYVRAKRFDVVQAYSLASGHDTAQFWGARSTRHLSTEDADAHRRAEAFEAVFAEAGTASDTAIFEGSTRVDDLFETGEG